MTDGDRERRVANAAKLFEAISPYTNVDSDARIAALHNELIYGIDRALTQNSQHRFHSHEIEVLKDISFQIVYVLDAMTQSPKGFRKALWHEFKRASPMKKIGAVGAVLLFLGGALGGTITFYHTTIKPLWAWQSTNPSAPKAQIPTSAQQKN
jgi:hypothetical protein